MFGPQKAALELLIVFTVRGLQPVVLSMLKAATGAGLTQMVLVTESVRQVVLPVNNLME